MNARTLLACALVLVAAPLSAQSDPITGRWGRDGTAVLDLKLDNTGAVTGQVMNGSPDNMVPIRSGSFDRQTGVLKLAGEAKSTDTGAATAFTILGNLVGDSLKVNAAFGNFSRIARPDPAYRIAPNARRNRGAQQSHQGTDQLSVQRSA